MTTTNSACAPSNVSPHDHAHGHGHDKHDHDKHAGHAPEMFRDRLWASLALTIPILYFWAAPDTPSQIQNWLSTGTTLPRLFATSILILTYALIPALATAIFFYGGGPFLKSARHELAARQPGMMTLISLAITVAYIYSLAVTAGLSGDTFYWELATLIDVMLLGHWIEMRSIQSASSALDELVKLLPTGAHRIELDGVSISDVPVKNLNIGDKILIRPGEQVPIDGDIVSGASSVNEALLTGESRPVLKERGLEVIAGSINGEGALTVIVTRTENDTTLSQIMRLVADAQASRSRFQLLADRAAFWLTLVAIGIAVPTFLIWASTDTEITFAIARAVTVLVVTCPHALGLAIPLVTANATTMASRNGILVRNREAFERGHNVRFVAFDKTGTLTEGSFIVSSVTTHNINTREALALAAALERSSAHPLAAAVVKAATTNNAPTWTATDVHAMPGQGLIGLVNSVEHTIGSPEWITHIGCSMDDTLAYALTEADQRGDTVIVLASSGSAQAVIALSDHIRDTSAAAVASLRKLDVTPVMISGDANAVAATVAADLGIERVYARILPDRKASIINELQQEAPVAFVGDGINDAPALLQADLGIAIGAGTNVAIESADLVLTNDDPQGVPRALRLSRLTRSKMIQNLGWAVGYNTVAIPLAAGAGVSFGILLSPAIGALLMSLSTIIVAINAMSMRRTTAMPQQVDKNGIEVSPTSATQKNMDQGGTGH